VFMQGIYFSYFQTQFLQADTFLPRSRLCLKEKTQCNTTHFVEYYSLMKLIMTVK